MLDFLKGYVKPADDSMIEIIWKWRNQEHIRKMMFHQDYIEWEDHVKWFRNILSATNKFLNVFYYDSLPKGIITFQSVEDNTNTFEWGFYLGDLETSKGMGTLLGIHAIDSYFNKNNCETLVAKVLEFNTKSLAFHKRLGFSQINLKTEYILKNKEYAVYHFILNKDQWIKKRVQLIEKYNKNADE